MCLFLTVKARTNAGNSESANFFFLDKVGTVPRQGFSILRSLRKMEQSRVPCVHSGPREEQ